MSGRSPFSFLRFETRCDFLSHTPTATCFHHLSFETQRRASSSSSSILVHHLPHLIIVQTTKTERSAMRGISLKLIVCSSLFGLISAAWVGSPLLSLQRGVSTTTARSLHRTLLSATPTIEDSETKAQQPLWTANDVAQFAEERGVIISFTTLGPGYRAVARAKHDESMILGYVEGFIRPAGQILHLDKMEVFKKMVERVKAQKPDALNFGGISFAIGLLLGYTCLLYGKEKGCNSSEFLAIDDEEFQHKRLVRYYTRVGFRVVKYVGDDITDVPARLVWGGCGTLMKEDIDVLLRKWANLLEVMKTRTKT